MRAAHAPPTATILGCAVLVTGALVLAGCGATSTGRAGADGVAGADAVAGAAGVAGADSAGGSRVTVGGDGADGADGSAAADGAVVTGSGRMISRQISVHRVTALDVGADFDVRVTIGQPEQATIRMDDNLADLVEATVHGDELRLGLRPGASVRDASLSAEVTVAGLDRITAGGISDVRLGSEIAAEQLRLDASGAGRISGAVRLDQALASASGAGTLELSGDVGRLQVTAAGTSELLLSDLTVRDLDVELSGASCATVAVSGTLTARADGVSALRYSGTPWINRDETSGLSSIAPDTLADDGCDT